MRLAAGEALASSQLKGEWVGAMIDDGILLPLTHKSRVAYRATSGDAVRQFLRDRYGILDMEQTLAVMEGDEAVRSEQVAAAGDSKIRHQRTMKGFLVTTVEPIEATLSGMPLVIHPTEGSFLYVYDYEQFRVADDVLIIGVENAENFRFISRQIHLFPPGKKLFVSRYPVSGDFPKWLSANTNPYLHFGDFDLAGIHIFLSEIYNKVGDRASFLVPPDVEERLKQGSRERYDVQLPRFGRMEVSDKRLLPLVALIHQYRKGYDQEGYIDK